MKGIQELTALIATQIRAILSPGTTTKSKETMGALRTINRAVVAAQRLGVISLAQQPFPLKEILRLSPLATTHRAAGTISELRGLLLSSLREAGISGKALEQISHKVENAPRASNRNHRRSTSSASREILQAIAHQIPYGMVLKGGDYLDQILWRIRSMIPPHLRKR